MSPPPSRSALCALPLLLASCGAGAISAALFGGDDGESPPALQPSVTITSDRGPLEIAAGERYEGTAVLSNIEIPAGAQVVVDLMLEAGAGGTDIVVRQPEVVLDAGTAGALRWRLETAPIRAAFADPTAQDVPVTVRFGAERPGEFTVLGTGSFTLLRKRVPVVAHPQNSMIPISGGSLALVVSPRLAGSQQVEVRTAPDRIRAAGVTARVDDDVADTTELTIAIPPGDTTEELEVTVVDREAGRSRPVAGLYYAPELFAVVGRSGSADGDELVSLVGAGLVPVRFEPGGTPVPELERVEVVVSKGGRSVVVDTASFLPSLSTPSALAMRTPPSPDGYPGSASIEIRARLSTSDGGEFVVSDQKKNLYAYAAGAPSFEPRGLAIGVVPAGLIGIDFGRLTSNDPMVSAADAVVMKSDPIDPVGLVSTLGNGGHGMFQRVGETVPTAEPGDPPMSQPTDCCVGDFVGDALADVAVLNFGSGGGNTITSILANSFDRRGLLRDFTPGFSVTEPLPLRVHRARFDQHPQDDLLVVAFNDAAIVESGTAYAPAWMTELFSEVFPQTGIFTIARPIDLGDDGVDEALFVVRTAAKLLLSFVLRDGTGLDAIGPIDLTNDLGGYAPTNAIDVDSGGSRELVFVLSPPDTQPAASDRIAYFAFDAEWEIAAAFAFDLPTTLGGAPFVVEALESADLNGDGRPELILGGADGGLLVYDIAGGFALAQRLTDFDGEPIGGVIALDWESAGQAESALYVSHFLQIGSVRELRITTLLPAVDGRLLGPKARVEFPRSLRRVVSASPVGDSVAVVFDDAIEFHESDRFGTLQVQRQIPVSEHVAGSVTSVTVDNRGWTVFVDRRGRLGGIGPGSTSVVWGAGTVLTGMAVGNPTVQGGSRIVSGDVDGDGLEDLVLLVRYDDDRGVNVEALVTVLASAATTFPYQNSIPHAAPAAEVTGAVSVDVGDFARDQGARVMEIAIANPSTGVKFFRYDRGTESVVLAQPIGSSPLAAGRSPSLLRAIDLDGDLVDDLVTLSGTRSELSFWAQQQPMTGTVNVAQFVRIDDEPSVPGTGLALEPADIDGDGIDDVVIVVEDQTLGQPLVGAVLWDGADRVRRSVGLIGERLGAVPTGMREDRAFSVAVVDTNQDGIRDIVIGWEAGVGGSPPSFMHTLFGSRR